jgi:RNA polymerase sigma factor (sigma-70 family)
VTTIDESGPVQEAFGELFRIAYVVAYRILGDVAEAEDVAAEAIARACLRWRKVAALPYRDAWVARVAANIAIDVVRRRGRTVATASDPVHDPIEAAVLRLVLVAALGGLSTRQREVVVLRYLADQAEADVARSLGISINTVKKHTLRGMAALRLRLGPTWEGVELDWT